MLDGIINSVKGQVANTIAEKTGLSMGQAEEAVPMAKDSIVDGVMGAVSGGNLGGVMGLFGKSSGGGGLVQNMVYKSIAGSFINKITSKFGIPESMASTVSSFALPMIMEKISGSVSNDKGEVDKGNLMKTFGIDAGSLMGNAADAMKDKLGDKLGGGIGKMFG